MRIEHYTMNTPSAFMYSPLKFWLYWKVTRVVFSTTVWLHRVLAVGLSTVNRARGAWGCGWGAGGYLVVPGLVATPLQQPLFNSERAGLQRGVRELEVRRLRRRARALRALGRATTGHQLVSSPTQRRGHSPHALPLGGFISFYH